MTVYKQSPLHTTVQMLGAAFQDEAGWQIPDRYADPDRGAAAARERVALADASASGKIVVEGRTCEGVVQSAIGIEPLDVGRGAVAGSTSVYRLRSDRFFVHTHPGDEAKTIAALESARPPDELVTVTDFTHGWAEIGVLGPSAAELLSRLCGLDFHESAFPNLTAKQSSVAKTSQLILRRDSDGVPAYSLLGPRSLAAYLWETAMEAGEDLGIIPVGWRILAQN